jgi:hypothetical protein
MKRLEDFGMKMKQEVKAKEGKEGKEAKEAKEEKVKGEQFKPLAQTI